MPEARGPLSYTYENATGGFRLREGAEVIEGGSY